MADEALRGCAGGAALTLTLTLTLHKKNGLKLICSVETDVLFYSAQSIHLTACVMQHFQHH
jgi:hypothetical protein